MVKHDERFTMKVKKTRNMKSTIMSLMLMIVNMLMKILICIRVVKKVI